ncbi:MAG: bifunctional diguanylate cyclase/phosphodiesterase, partial [Geminicoccaceae bacterium]|nr:bifunctional diguanylate cyclase/phosphodiesterase [Geminicoccaceae bacterium]
ARLGGDEFAVLLPGAPDAAAAAEIAHRIVDSLQVPFVLGELQVEVAASIGIALVPEHAQEPVELLQRADVAMYAAKRQQLGVTVYEPENDQHSVRRLILHGELRRAIEDGALQLFYQPKIQVRTGRLTGVEALVRWPHPDLGRISPEEFIPFAEQTGLIRPLTDWALQEAVAQHRRWRRAGHDIPVAVNLAAQSLQDPMLAEQVASIVGDDRGGLRIEITESGLMADPAVALLVLEQLSVLGCRPALDDFGTGYSCLAYLQRLPIDQLKIDRSFVAAMGADPGATAIVRSIIGLAHSLGLSVVAEGVETETDLDALRRLGCDEVQGFLFAPPLDASAFDSWLSTFPGTPCVTACRPPSRDAERSGAIAAGVGGLAAAC